MDNSIYIVLSRQLAQFQDMEVTSNNIANASTPGFNAQKLVFAQHLVDSGKTGQKDAYAETPYSYRDTSNGAINMTGNPFDLAIKGNGYFQVETPLGTRYSKAGNFQLDATGVLINASGYAVLGNDGSQITLPPGSKNVEINAIGQITVDGQAAGQVGMVEFNDEQKLTRAGSNLFIANATPQPAATARMVQGAIEASNVNGVTELVRVMDISRNFAANSKFIEAMYDMERKASATLATVKPA